MKLEKVISEEEIEWIKEWKEKHWGLYACLSKLSLAASNKGLFQTILIENQREGVVQSQGTCGSQVRTWSLASLGPGTPELRASWLPPLSSAWWFLIGSLLCICVTVSL